jgi:hypothetical protein
MIIIDKSVTTPNDITVKIHAFEKVILSPDSDAFDVYIASWASMETFQLKHDPIARAFERVNLINLTGPNFIETLANYIANNGLLAGGMIITLGPETLEMAQKRKWHQIKEIRNQKEFGGFIWDTSKFDSDSLSQARIQAAVLMAMQAAQADESFEVIWTLADNTTRPLTSAEVLEVGRALAQHIHATFVTSRLLRDQINEAETIEEVESINWPEE